MSFLNQYTDETIRESVEQSSNLADVLFKLGGIVNSTTNRMVLTQYIKNHQIDTSHFIKHDRLTDAEMFCEHSHASQRSLKKRYKDGEYTDYKCAICGLEPLWNGKELVLILDHINGKHDDDRIENLRWVCPNCNRQLSTSNGKNAKRTFAVKRIKKEKEKEIFYCGSCGAVVSQKGNLCNACAGVAQRKSERPPALELARMIKELGFVAVGEKYGVCDNTIKKWCKSYCIPHKIKELIAWYNEQMGIEEKPRALKPKGVFSQPKPVKQIDPNTGNIINVFSSQKAACKALGVTPSDHIGQVCKGIRKMAYKYFWQYA